jgi:hypothetical protein
MPSDASVGFDVLGLLDLLEGVDLIVVGGIAAALHGGPRVTVDLDVVPSSAAPNVERLGERLESVDAVIREPGNRRLPVTAELLRSTISAPSGGQLRLRTKLGALDILWRLHDGRGYDDLLPTSVVLSDEARSVRVIGLDDLIVVKEAAGRPQDQQDVRYLELVRRRMRR